MVEKMAFDSREVTPGTLFVAVKGTKTDGHEYISSAVASGTVAVICETIPDNAPEGVCWIRTGDSAKALGIVASEFYGNPSASLKLTGVTGTNGKTTIATYLQDLYCLEQWGFFSQYVICGRKGLPCYINS